MYTEERWAALGWMYEDDEHPIYSDEFCRIQQEAAPENFDMHKLSSGTTAAMKLPNPLASA